MRSVLALCSLALASCQIAPAPQSIAPDSKPLFPPAKAGFTLQADERGGPTLDWVLDEFEKATGMHFVVSGDSARLLSATQCGLRAPIEVPAASVYPIAESLLVWNGFAIVPLNRGEPFLVAIQSLTIASMVKESALQVDAAQLSQCAEHPALLVQTVVDLDPIDVRMLSTSLRQLMPDQNTQSILPLTGGNRLLLTGFAPRVSEWCRVLSEAAAHERQRQEEAQRQPPATEPAKPH